MSTSSKWIIGLIVILISLIQAFVWYAAFVNAGNGSALNFVSFAGTLISIILAILAIGYTYGESISQKSKADSLSIQIASLTEVTGAMRIQSDALSEVSNIKAELESVASRIESGFLETKETVSVVSTAIGAVNKKFDDINLVRSAPFVVSGLDKTEVARSFLAARTPLMEISILMIAYFSDHQKRPLLSPACDDAVSELIKSVHEDSKYNQSLDHVVSLFTGSVLSSLSTLEGFGLVSRQHNTGKKIATAKELMSIDPALRNELLNTVIANPMRSGPLYAAIRSKMITSLQEQEEWNV